MLNKLQEVYSQLVPPDWGESTLVIFLSAVSRTPHPVPRTSSDSASASGFLTCCSQFVCLGSVALIREKQQVSHPALYFLWFSLHRAQMGVRGCVLRVYRLWGLLPFCRAVRVAAECCPLLLGSQALRLQEGPFLRCLGQQVFLWVMAG